MLQVAVKKAYDNGSLFESEKALPIQQIFVFFNILCY